MPIDHLILPGRYEEAVQQLGTKDPSRVRHFLEARGVRDSVLAHMCLGRFAEASLMAEAMIARFPRKVSWDYIYAGMIQWFQRRRSNAAAIWTDGLTCGYTFYSGLDCSLLLWYASVRTPSLSSAAAIERMQRPSRKRIRSWNFVDAVVRYIFDEIDEAEARRLAFNEHWEHITATHLAQLDFYVAARHFSRGNRRAFRKFMEQCATTEGLDSTFPELLIARYEVGMFPFQHPAGTDNTAPRHPTTPVRPQKRRI